MTDFLKRNPPNLPPELWQKVCAILMHKTSTREIRITEEDVAELNKGGAFPVIGTHFHKGGELSVILFKDIKEAEAYTLAHPEGRRVV